jgi:nitroreductase
METLKCIHERREIREFKPEPIPEDITQKVLLAAVQAPSAGNVQDWEFVMVKSGKNKEALASAATDQDFVARAPVVIAVCSNLKKIGRAYGQRGLSLYSVQDTAAAAQNILLAAWSLGIGGCWVGAFDERKVSELLFLPEHVRPLALIPLGFPTRIPAKPKRNPFQICLHTERY